MDWHNEIAADWPAPRDDEPTSLRQDIVDELADHLRCSMNREVHVTADEKQAERNVLNRFGNPAGVARKLWLDEMWEKIMLQRATFAVTAILAAAGVAACVMLGMVLEQNRTVNAAILQSLQNVSAPAAELKSLEWNPVRVRVVSGKPSGPSMEGIRVTLNGNIVGTGKSTANGYVEKTTDKYGMVDFGLVRPGYFTLTTTSPWSETMSQQLTVRPGTTEPYEVVCPTAVRKEADVAVSVEWPDELKDKKLWLVADFAIGTRQVNRADWYPPYGATSMSSLGFPAQTGLSGGRPLLLSPDGKQTLFPTDPTWRQTEKSFQIEQQRLVFSDGKSIDLEGSLPWPEGTVKLLALGVVQAATTKGGGVTQERLPFDNRTEYRFADGSMYGGSMSGMGGGFGGGSGMGSAGEMSSMSAAVPTPPPTFRVIPGKPNRWTISLPDELVKRVKQRLASFKGSGLEPEVAPGTPGVGSQD
ncbi:MAG: hypothetical protein HON53_13860 [Planctomycetaceae bacterium]|nr:hypothetical protein [Planctomycetaceae bacterium]MBT6156531.1 hypothetical protein [Planctomycetaceae bacterium]MBT6484676.1 hypothetical protein [Planctomycetaceae bacterium]MBT6493007.1 hypothetical protein [Planctomycetaceae bacterium]